MQCQAVRVLLAPIQLHKQWGSMERQPLQKFYLLVPGLGALGGLLYWLFSLWIGTPHHVHPAFGIIISVALGSGASFIFIVLIANTDRTDKARLLALSLVAGFFWEPVWIGARGLVDYQMDEKRTQAAIEVIDEALETAALLENANEEDRPELIERLSRETARLTELTSSIKSVSNLAKVDEKFVDLYAMVDKLPIDEPQIDETPTIPETAPPTTSPDEEKLQDIRRQRNLIEQASDSGYVLPNGINREKKLTPTPTPTPKPSKSMLVEFSPSNASDATITFHPSTRVYVVFPDPVYDFEIGDRNIAKHTILGDRVILITALKEGVTSFKAKSESASMYAGLLQISPHV